jgi:hypothetical protein
MKVGTVIWGRNCTTVRNGINMAGNAPAAGTVLLGQELHHRQELCSLGWSYTGRNFFNREGTVLNGKNYTSRRNCSSGRNCELGH